MNERIRELAIQAGFFYEDYKDIWYLEYHNETCEEEIKKFAQLIVRECAGIYDKIDNGNLHMGTDDYLEALDKTFFGVEE
jgi:hypothetical protein